MNSNNNPDVLCSAGLLIYPLLGQVQAGDATITLGPINMKVLALLISNPGQPVSRSDFYEHIWGQQVVSDDALTRCISDIRSELSRYCSEDKLIETLPKRGYRWLPAVEQLTAEPAESKRSLWTQYFGFSLLSTVIIAVLTMALLNYLGSSQHANYVRIALMPVEVSSDELKPLGVELEDSIKQHILATSELRFVSRRVLDGYPQANYSAYARELNVKWVFESEIRKTDQKLQVSLSLVDPYTSLVEFNQVVDTSILNVDLDTICTKFLSESPLAY